jgi:hypothetical protein
MANHSLSSKNHIVSNSSVTGAETEANLRAFCETTEADLVDVEAQKCSSKCFQTSFLNDTSQTNTAGRKKGRCQPSRGIIDASESERDMPFSGASSSGKKVHRGRPENGHWDNARERRCVP